MSSEKKQILVTLHDVTELTYDDIKVLDHALMLCSFGTCIPKEERTNSRVYHIRHDDYNNEVFDYLMKHVFN